MTQPLGGVHVDVEISVEDVGPDLRRALRGPVERTAREVEQTLADAGHRGGQRLAEGIGRGADGRLGDVRGRFVQEGDRAGLGFVRGFSTGLAAGGGLAGALARSTAGLAGDLAALGAGLGGVLAAGGLGALGATAAAGGIAALAGELSELVGVLGLIPAAAAGAGLAIGTLVIGFQGIGDAIDADTPEEWAEALENLAPSARATAIAVKNLADEATNLRLAVQDRLFAGMADTINELGAAYLPRAQRGFAGLATEINRGARAFAEMLLSAQSLQDTDTIFANVRASIASLGPAGADFGAALRDITTVGSEFLPEIADRIAAISDRFAAFIAQARESGALADFFDTALESVSTLLSVLGNIGSTFASVFQAADAAGINLLGTLERLTGRLADFLNTAAGEQELADFFAQVAEAGQLLLPILDQVGGLLGVLGPLLFDIGAVLAPVIAEVIGDLTAALDAAGPGLLTFASGFRAVLDAAGPAIVALGELAGVIADSLGQVLARISETLGETVTVLAESLTEALSDPALIDGIVELVEGIGAVAQAAGPAIAAAGRLAGVLASSLGQVLERVGPQLVRVADTLADTLADALSDPALIDGVVDIATAFGDLVEALAPILPQLARLAGEILTTLADVLGPLVENLLPPLVDLFGALEPVISPILDLISALVDVLEPLIELIGFVLEAIGALVEGIATALGAVVGFAEDVVTGIAGAADGVSGFETLIENMSLLTEEALGRAGTAAVQWANVFDLMGLTVAAAAGTATQAVIAFADGTVGAIGRAVEAVVAGTAAIGSAVVNNLRPVGPAGEAAFGRLARAAGAALQDTLTAARRTVGEIGSVFRGADFSAAGSALIRSLAAGMVGSAAMSAIRNAANQVVGAIGSFLPSSPAKRGPFSGRGWTPYRGQSLVEGFAAGMLSRVALVMTAAHQVAGAAQFAGAFTAGGRVLAARWDPAHPAYPPAASGGATSKSVVLNQTVHVPATDPLTFAAMSGAHARAAISKVM